MYQLLPVNILKFTKNVLENLLKPLEKLHFLCLL